MREILDSAMDVSRPIRSVIPTLDGPVLEVLSQTTRPLSGREVQRLAGVGSPNGVRSALARLVGQGVVHEQHIASATLYVGNREHLAWPAIETLAGIRRALLANLRATFATWSVSPVHASMFGSTARSDGDVNSDIDILLIRPGDVEEDEAPWADGVDQLRRSVRSWTGNHCQAFQIDPTRLDEYRRMKDPLVDNWLRDGITLAGPDLRTILRSR